MCFFSISHPKNNFLTSHKQQLQTWTQLDGQVLPVDFNTNVLFIEMKDCRCF